MSFALATRPAGGRARARCPSSRACRRAAAARTRFTVSFYLTAMLFIVFDIEIVFLYPLAVVLDQLAWFGFVELLVFIAHPRARLRLHLAEGGARVAVRHRSRCRHQVVRALPVGPPASPSRNADPRRGAEKASRRLRAQVRARALAGQGPGCLRAGARRPRGPADADDRRARRSRWAQTNSIWPDTFGLACCAIEMMSIVSSRYDIARFGAEVVPLVAAPGRPADRLRPRRAQDGGAAAPDLRPDARAEVGDRDGRLRELRRDVQQLHHRCRASTRSSPVDIHVPGCPPRPEALIEGIVRLHEKIKAGVPPAYEIRGVAS